MVRCPPAGDRSRAERRTERARQACRAAGLAGRICHDFRRTAARNLLRAGVPESWAMQLTGHKTPAIFRYAITNEADLREAVTKLATSLGHSTGTIGRRAT